MPAVTLEVPVTVALATVSFEVPVDDYLSIAFREGSRKALHKIEGAAPEFLKARHLAPQNPKKRHPELAFSVDLETGQIKDWPDAATIAPEATGVITMFLHTKVRDGFSFRLLTPAGHAVLTQVEDYVPGFMPGNDSDYVELEIELETGLIRDWKRYCTKDALQRIADLSKESPYIKASLPPAA